MNTLLVTVPRMGSHFLIDYMRQTTNINITSSHSVPYRMSKYITIARDPKESFISSLTITKHYSPDVDLGDPSRVLVKQTNLYKHILETADIVIDYNDLINRTEDVKKYLVMRLKGKSNDKPYISRLSDDASRKYLLTSKTSQHYADSIKIADTLDFSSFNAIHTKMLERKIDLDCCPL
jgi:hypothetical protein